MYRFILTFTILHLVICMYTIRNIHMQIHIHKNSPYYCRVVCMWCKHTRRCAQADRVRSSSMVVPHRAMFICNGGTVSFLGKKVYRQPRRYVYTYACKTLLDKLGTKFCQNTGE